MLRQLALLSLLFAIISGQDFRLLNKKLTQLRKLNEIKDSADTTSYSTPFLAEDLSFLGIGDLNLTQSCAEDVMFWGENILAFFKPANCTGASCPRRNVADNQFAIEQLDSWGKPPAGIFRMATQWMGSWEECLGVKAPKNPLYETKYCWTQIVPPIFLLANQQCTKDHPTTSAATCMPKTCSEEEIVKILNSITKKNLVCSVKCRDSDPPPRDAAFWVVSAILIFVSTLVILSSFVDYFIVREDSHKDFNASMRLLLTFSVYTNGREVLDMSTREGQIDVVHCIRFFSMSWVIAAHCVMVCFLQADNAIESVEMLKYFFNYMILNGFVSVDSFFFLSGLLLAYLFFKEVNKNPKHMRNPMTWVLFYVHRFLRLTPPYMMFIGFYVAYFKHFTIGPHEWGEDDAIQFCTDNWWTNILYVNNLVHDKKMCYAITWYLAADMQMHVFAPILLVALFINQWIGLAVGVGFLALSTGANYGTFYRYHFYPTMIHIPTLQPEDKLADMTDFVRLNYYAAWIRCLPYVVGVLTGYFLQKYKDTRVKLHPILTILGWFAAFACAFGSVFGIFDYMNNRADWDVFTRASYNNFSRLGWGVSLAFVVIACQKGFAGPIKNIMSLKFFIPLGRLSYCAYLVHFFVVYVYVAMTRSSVHWVSVIENYTHIAIPCIIISYLFAFVWSLMFEIPFGKIEKMAIDALTRRKPMQSFDLNVKQTWKL